MISLLLSVSLAADTAKMRTDMARLDPAEVFVMTCRTAADEAGQDWTRVIDVWWTCDAEARRRELGEAQPLIRGEIAMAEVERDFGHLRTEAPVDFARIVLAVSAQRREVQLPYDAVEAAWLRVMADNEARLNLEDVRSVTVRMLPNNSGTAEQRDMLAALLRREIGDLGFKISPEDQAEAADAAIMVFAEPGFREAQEGDASRGRLSGWEVELKTQPIRYKTREVKGPPLRVTERADYREADDAVSVAMEACAASFAQALLLQVVREVYTDYALPEPGQPAD